MGSWEPYTTPPASPRRIRIQNSDRHPLKCPIRNDKDGILRLRGTIGVRIWGKVAPDTFYTGDSSSSPRPIW